MLVGVWVLADVTVCVLHCGCVRVSACHPLPKTGRLSVCPRGHILVYTHVCTICLCLWGECCVCVWTWVIVWYVVCACVPGRVTMCARVSHCAMIWLGGEGAHVCVGVCGQGPRGWV